METSIERQMCGQPTGSGETAAVQGVCWQALWRLNLPQEEDLPVGPGKPVQDGHLAAHGRLTNSLDQAGRDSSEELTSAM
eukprot:12394598-Prorocentrum_lima.AAC.1